MPPNVKMYAMVVVSLSSLDGAFGGVTLDMGTAVARLHAQSERRPEAFQMLASDRFGEQVGQVVLAFCVEIGISPRFVTSCNFHMHHLAESLREDDRSSDLAVCAQFGSYVMAQLFQTVSDEQCFDEARSNCVEFIAVTQRRGPLHRSSRDDHSVVQRKQSSVKLFAFTTITQR